MIQKPFYINIYKKTSYIIPESAVRSSDRKLVSYSDKILLYFNIFVMYRLNKYDFVSSMREMVYFQFSVNAILFG